MYIYIYIYIYLGPETTAVFWLRCDTTILFRTTIFFGTTIFFSYVACTIHNIYVYLHVDSCNQHVGFHPYGLLQAHRGLCRPRRVHMGFHKPIGAFAGPAACTWAFTSPFGPLQALATWDLGLCRPWPHGLSQAHLGLCRPWPHGLSQAHLGLCRPCRATWAFTSPLQHGMRVD